MPNLISLEEARRQCRVDHNDEDDVISMALDASTQLVLNYLTRRDTDWNAEMSAWTSSTLPKPVRQAILIQTREIYERTPMEKSGEMHPTGLSLPVRNLLIGYSEPGYA